MKKNSHSQNIDLNTGAASIFCFPFFEDSNGDIVVMENDDVLPFSIARVFVVRGQKGVLRGQHAHKECSQVLICSNGSIDVICDDGIKTKTYSLNQPNLGLYLPPGIWAEQRYNENSILTVLCDQKFNESEYIRDYEEFKSFI